MTRYVQRKDGEGWTVQPGRIFRIACCECGLVHDMAVAVVDGEVGIAARRNNRATALRRRWQQERLV